MQSLIVPIDFSEVSHNAARYAMGLAAQLKLSKLVLYHSMISEFELDDINKSRNELAELAKELQQLQPNVQVLHHSNTHYMLESIEELIKEHDPAAIVMGITGKNKLEQTLIGSNTLKIAQEASRPVLIVPREAKYQPVINVLIGVDFKPELLEAMPGDKIVGFVNALEANLLVLNVDTHSFTTLPREAFAGQQAAHEVFKGAKVSFHFTEGSDVVQLMEQFANENNVQVLISVLKEHSFFERLYKGSITKKLAFHTHLPILVWREHKYEKSFF